MASLNSLLFLFSTLAPNMEPPGNSAVTPLPPHWIESSVPDYGQIVPGNAQYTCRINEYPSCMSHCQKNCTNYDQDIPCPKICVYGCVCVEGFIRGPDDTCIRPYECPAALHIPDARDITEESVDIQCGADEEVSPYPHCQRNCTNFNQVILCPGEGPRGCVCNFPLVRGPDGNCITSVECPVFERHPQAIMFPLLKQTACHLGEYASCKSHCQRNCKNYDQEIPCPDICVLDCVCIEPFIRGNDGSCIMPSECPATAESPETMDDSDDFQCQPEEMVSVYVHCERNCSNIGETVLCPSAGPPGCMCKPPRIRGPDGRCIMIEECPPLLRSTQDSDDPSDMKCPNNEEVSCFSHCQRNCTNYAKPFHCPLYCVTGCVCTPPMIRGPTGSCIMPEQCNVLQKTLHEVPEASCQDWEECDENEDIEDENEMNLKYLAVPFDNFKICEDENEIYKLYSPECPDICQVHNYRRRVKLCRLLCSPLAKCECKDGFVRGPNGNCIAPEQSPREEEVPDASCNGSQECEDKENKDIENEASLRSLAGPFDSFKICQDKNEVYKLCSSQCPDDCDNYNDTRRVCKLICLPFPKCECKDGFVRGPSGNCIVPEKCPPPKEVPDASCNGSQECEDKENKDIENEANLRSLAGPYDSFKICKDKNEVYKLCSSQCPDDCENYNDTRRACKFVCLPFPKCECKNGFVRGPNGNCIVPEKCPPPQFSSKACFENEVYKVCGSPCEKDCQNYKDPLIIPCVFVCESGCFCKGDMVRGPDGDCISKEECPAKLNQPKKYIVQREKVLSESARNTKLRYLPDLPTLSCKENEVFSLCAPFCPDDCTNYKEYRFCKRICVPGCKCIDGYVKGKNGNCIKKEDCEEKKGNNCSDFEDYKVCGCEKDCNNYNVTDRKCENRECRAGCFCKTDLVRSPDGQCIHPDSCLAPEKGNKCSDLEDYKVCGCETDCNNYNVTDRKCENTECREGCFCKTALVRSPDGKCINPDSCLASEKNNVCSNLEIYKDCGCERDCRNYNVLDYKCEDGECRAGCFCKMDFVRSPDGKCIHPDSCSAPETYRSYKFPFRQ